MKILIGADIVPTISNQQFFENAQMEKIVDQELMDILKSADYRILNLEVPLTNQVAPINKCGPNLVASTKSVIGLKQLGIDLLTLANNHILDQGEQGLWSTIEQLDKAGIAYAGAGHTPVEAAKPHIIELNGKKIGVYCCAEHEFSIVSDKQAGANPFDPLESFDHIVDLKAQCDYLIVLYHGGKEHYRYPSPNLQKVCRRLAACGADLVVCQHSHCIGCEEVWNQKSILYGQGNFLFDDDDSDYWKTSVLVSVDIGTKRTKIEYIPIVKCGNGVRLANDIQGREILEELRRRSEEIRDPAFVEQEYLRFAQKHLNDYLRKGVPLEQSLVLRILNRIFNRKLFVKWLPLNNKMALLNFLECEAHRELLIRGLQDEIRQ